MLILTLDTSTPFCHLALFDDETMLANLSKELGNKHAEYLLDLLDELLLSQNKKVQNIDRIIVNIGPGSFTGIRVGVSTARALGLGLDCDVVGINTFEAMARLAQNIYGQKAVTVIINAYRDEVYVQKFTKDLSHQTQAFILPYTELSSLLSDSNEDMPIFIGSGLQYLISLQETLKEPIILHETDHAEAQFYMECAQNYAPISRSQS